jgi:hypothetical protein
VQCVRAHVCSYAARRCRAGVKQGNLIAPVFAGELKKIVFYCAFENVTVSGLTATS